MSALQPTHGLHILAVEDDVAQAHGLRVLLTQMGYELVGVAATQAEALAMFDEQHPDVVLLDIHLRGTDDGVEVGRLLNERRRVPLIFLTSYADDATFGRARAVGPHAFLAKPYGPALLHHAIELAAQRHFGASPEGVQKAPDEYFFVRDVGQMVRVRYTDVHAVEADAPYVQLYTAQRRYTVRLSLRQLLDRLPPGQFTQVHRAWLVRVQAIEAVHYSNNVVQMPGLQVPLGRNWRDELRQQLPQLG